MTFSEKMMFEKAAESLSSSMPYPGGRSAASSSTASPSLLSAWLSMSSGPHVCSTCSKSFPSSQALGGHQNAHRRQREEVRVRYFRERLERIRTTTATNNNGIHPPPRVLPLGPDLDYKIQALTMSVGGYNDRTEHRVELDFWHGHGHGSEAADGYGKAYKLPPPPTTPTRSRRQKYVPRRKPIRNLLEPMPSLELTLGHGSGTERWESFEDEHDEIASETILDLTLRL